VEIDVGIWGASWKDLPACPAGCRCNNMSTKVAKKISKSKPPPPLKGNFLIFRLKN